MKSRLAAWLLVFAWAAIIFCMSSNTGDDLSSSKGLLGMIKQLLDNAQVALLGPGVDVASSAAHFAEYSVLSALLSNAITLSKQRPCRRVARVFLAVLIASLYGITDEIHQLFAPGRFCDPVDWLVDTAGAFVGAEVYCGYADRRSRK